MKPASPSRQTRMVLLCLAAALVILLALGILWARRAQSSTSSGTMLARVEYISSDQVSCVGIDWFEREDEQASHAWWTSYWETGSPAAAPLPLAQGAQLLYYHGDQVYPLNDATILFSIHMSQAGQLCELTCNDDGQVVKLVMRGDVHLDLAAPDLDFTGFTGTVYARGTDGARFAPNSYTYIQGPRASDAITFFAAPAPALEVDPCLLEGWDDDHTLYPLPLAEGVVIPTRLVLPLSLSPSYTGHYPQLYVLELENGAVISLDAIWPDDSDPL